MYPRRTRPRPGSGCPRPGPCRGRERLRQSRTPTPTPARLRHYGQASRSKHHSAIDNSDTVIADYLFFTHNAPHNSTALTFIHSHHTLLIMPGIISVTHAGYNLAGCCRDSGGIRMSSKNPRLTVKHTHTQFIFISLRNNSFTEIQNTHSKPPTNDQQQDRGDRVPKLYSHALKKINK